jgi:hypothetical protein
MEKVFLVFVCDIEDTLFVAARSTLKRARNRAQELTPKAHEHVLLLEAPVDFDKDFPRGEIWQDGDKKFGYIRHPIEEPKRKHVKKTTANAG